MLTTLRNLNSRIAVAIMIALIILGVYLGNLNALTASLSSADAQLPAVREVMAVKAGQAANIAVLCRELNQSDSANAMEEYRRKLSGVSNAPGIADINNDFIVASGQTLAALNDLTLDDRQKKLVVSIDDELTSAQNRFKREVMKYNEGIIAARATYDRLPTRFLMSKPEGFNL